jgi:hypothetical protein
MPRNANSQAAAASTPAAQVATATLTVRSKHKGSIRFDAPSSADDAIMQNVYLDKYALVNNFTAPKAGLIPGTIKLSVEVTEWVDGAAVKTGDQIKAEREAKKN